jgi:hypothetical protein
MNRQHKRASSGQILAVSALVIALIMTSTAMYIYELSGNIGEADLHLLNDFVNSVELGSRHAIIAALANITNAGQNETLAAYLNEWKAAVLRQYWLGEFTLDYTLKDTSPYSSGLHISWGTGGNGISEAYAVFQLNASGRDMEMQRSFNVNVSTGLHIQGYMTQITPTTKQVTITCSLFNEGQPAVAESIVLYYEEAGQWLAPDAANNYVVVNYGNGTYLATFTVETLSSSLGVSAHVFDERSILVQANATCLQQ